MKKLMSILTVLAIILSLAACKQKPKANNDAADAGDNQNSEQAGTPQENEKQVSDDGQEYIMVNTSSTYFNAEKLEEQSDLIIICRFDGKESQIMPDKNVKGYTNNVYTQQTVNLISKIKGEAPNDINVRRIGGKSDDGKIVESNDPKLISGKQYLLYLTKLPPATANDADSYCVLDYFEIDENGDLNTSRMEELDAQKINNLYRESAK